MRAAVVVRAGWRRQRRWGAGAIGWTSTASVVTSGRRKVCA